MAHLVEVAAGVHVATAELYRTTSTVIAGPAGACPVVDPAVTAADLGALARALTALALRPEAGFSTHPHWDHVLWCRALGEAPRYAAARAAAVAQRERRDLTASALKAAPGQEVERLGRLTPLLVGAASVPWSGPTAEIIVHDAHAPGHTALFLPDRGVLIAGDMLSDVEIPLLDLAAADPLGDYRRGLERLAVVAGRARIVVAGHGHVGDGVALRRRLDADRRYLDDLEGGRPSADPRLMAAWLGAEHDAQWARVHPGRRVPH